MNTNFFRGLAAVILMGILPCLAMAANRYTATVTVTNAPTHGLTFTVNSDVRTWKTNSTLASDIAITNFNSGNATNLYSAIAAQPFAGPLTLTYGVSNQIKLSALPGNSLAVTVPAAWGRVSIATNSTTEGTVVRVPVSAELTATVRTNVGAGMVSGINSYATNRFVLSVLPIGSPTNVVTTVPWLGYSFSSGVYTLATNATRIGADNLPLTVPTNITTTVPWLAFTSGVAPVLSTNAVRILADSLPLTVATNVVGTGGIAVTFSSQTYTASGTNLLDLPGTRAMTGVLNFGGNKGTNVATGTAPLDVVNYAQLTNALAGAGVGGAGTNAFNYWIGTNSFDVSTNLNVNAKFMFLDTKIYPGNFAFPYWHTSPYGASQLSWQMNTNDYSFAWMDKTGNSMARFNSIAGNGVYIEFTPPVYCYSTSEFYGGVIARSTAQFRGATTVTAAGSLTVNGAATFSNTTHNALAIFNAAVTNNSTYTSMLIGTNAFVVNPSGGIIGGIPLVVFNKFAVDGIAADILRIGVLGGAATQANSNRVAAITFGDGDNGTLVGAIGGIRNNPYTDFKGGLVFYANNTTGVSTISSLTQIGRWDNAGNLGIGTAPAGFARSRLDVAFGDIRCDSNINAIVGFQINSVAGKTGSVTNLGPTLGSSNVVVFAGGIVTNWFIIP